MAPRSAPITRRTAVPAAAWPDDRQDLHNTAVDEQVAGTGGCGRLHVQTGRTCTLRYRHPGSCGFVARDQVEASLAARRAPAGW
jgi:hypothetical protein